MILFFPFHFPSSVLVLDHFRSRVFLFFFFATHLFLEGGRPELRARAGLSNSFPFSLSLFFFFPNSLHGMTKAKSNKGRAKGKADGGHHHQHHHHRGLRLSNPTHSLLPSHTDGKTALESGAGEETCSSVSDTYYHHTLYPRERERRREGGSEKSTGWENHLPPFFGIMRRAAIPVHLIL
jgi:hypothetical protein